jgi:hypothetical protein
VTTQPDTDAPPTEHVNVVAVAPPEGTRLILVNENLLDTWGSRTDDGYAIRVKWGEPDYNGWYTPIFTVDFTDRLNVADHAADFGSDT